MNEHELWHKVLEIDVHVTRLTERLDNRFDGVAREGWVREFVRPIQDSFLKMEMVVASLSEDAKSLFAAHDALLTEKAETEKQQAKDRTPLGIVKKYAPMFGLVGGLVTAYRVLGTALELWLNYQTAKGR